MGDALNRTTSLSAATPTLTVYADLLHGGTFKLLVWSLPDGYIKNYISNRSNFRHLKEKKERKETKERNKIKSYNLLYYYIIILLLLLLLLLL